MEILRNDSVRIARDKKIKVYFGDGKNFLIVDGMGRMQIHQNTEDNKDLEPGVYEPTWKKVK